MADTAVPRQWDYPGQTLEDWLTQRVRANPMYPLPAGYVIRNGQVVRDTHGLLDAIGKWAPLAGLGIAGASGAGLFGGGASGAVPSVGATAGLPTAAGTGLAAGSGLKTGMELASLGLSALPMLGVGRSSGQVPGSQGLEQILQMQAGRMKQGQPLYDAILKMAMGLLPITAQGR